MNLYNYQQSIFPEQNKDIVTKAIERIRFAWEVAKNQGKTELYVCFSGGKDSVVLAKLCEMARVPYRLHYNITGIDPPELYHFIQRNKKVEFHWYEKSMRQLIIAKKIPPLRQMRYCCAELKEHGGTDEMCLTGVRWAESVRRANTRYPFENFGNSIKQKMLFNDNDEGRRGFETCTMKRKLITNPLIDWSDSDIWDFIKLENIPYCELYDKGYKRLGCICCPMASVEEKERQLNDYPKFKDYYVKSFDMMLATHERRNNWKNGNDVFDWWIYGNHDNVLENQIEMEIY